MNILIFIFIAVIISLSFIVSGAKRNTLYSILVCAAIYILVSVIYDSSSLKFFPIVVMVISIIVATISITLGLMYDVIKREKIKINYISTTFLFFLLMILNHMYCCPTVDSEMMLSTVIKYLTAVYFLTVVGVIVYTKLKKLA